MTRINNDIADSWIAEVIRPLRAEALAAEIDLMGSERESIIADNHKKMVMRTAWVVLAVVLFVWCVS